MEGQLLIRYPRRQVVRSLLRAGIRLIMPLVAGVEVVGRENIPAKGPLLVVGNHFSFLDPVVLIKITDWPLEFIGGVRRPNAPSIVSWFADAWGVLPAYRGSVARGTILASKSILAQGGVLAIFPEGGSWATVLRPPRPGAAFLSTVCNAPILPIGLNGLTEVFSKFRGGKRAHARIQIGKPFGPFYVSERGETDRNRLAEIGHEIMQHIAALVHPNQRGFYSDDPAIRAAAQGTEIYPWAGSPEA
ncbi:MAG: 1-acyl-sn-glycerol-3-phosphate acyltransferase [Anaerolineaceae bacterium]|nr:1-acyl-sn-glycerol-3-phosphate acyltransferase [Anaerolineaceae bacterium]